MGELCAPDKAVHLFNGKDLSNWRRRDGSPAQWKVEEGVVKVVPGGGDIVSDETYTDAVVHVEFLLPDMPEATGQAKANSGVFLQGRYEIQVLDSYGWAEPGLGDCGAIYNQFAPLVNACKPPLQWQTYDVAFRAPRVQPDGTVLNHARMTVAHNGVIIHNNVELLGPTGGPVDVDLASPGPLLLQDHGDLVQYRNVWLVHLPLVGSSTYEPH